MIHQEEFVYLPHVSHDRALVAWGAFFFAPDDGRFELMDDDALEKPPVNRRFGSIGFNTEPYGPATVRITELAADGAPRGTRDVPAAAGRNHAWITGLRPDTRYEYEVFVKGRTWGAAPADFQSGNGRKGTLAAAAWRYRNEFTTFPAPEGPAGPVTFVVVGDPGTGKPAQYELAAVLERVLDQHPVRFVVTTGDNIYATSKLGKGFDALEKAVRKVLGDPRSSGKEDDDWLASYFLPYRRIINRVPVFPALGNHDSSETEHDSDLAQLVDNFYLEERFPGVAPRWRNAEGIPDSVFYTFRCGPNLEMVCIDTSRPVKRPAFGRPEHKQFLDALIGDGFRRWRIPFGHHPPFSVGPNHGYEQKVQALVNSFTALDGFRLWLAGHEHNFQHHRMGQLHYVVTGASGKKAEGVDEKLVNPDLTCCHAARIHFLLVTVDGDRATVLPIGTDGNPVPTKRVGGFPAHPAAIQVTL